MRWYAPKMANRESMDDHELTSFRIDPDHLCAVASDDEIIIYLSEDESITLNLEAARLITKTLSKFVQ